MGEAEWCFHTFYLSSGVGARRAWRCTPGNFQLTFSSGQKGLPSTPGHESSCRLGGPERDREREREIACCLGVCTVWGTWCRAQRGTSPLLQEPRVACKLVLLERTGKVPSVPGRLGARPEGRVCFPQERKVWRPRQGQRSGGQWALPGGGCRVEARPGAR